MLEPLYTAAEMRAVEERYPGYPDTIPELMERAGTAVAQEAMRAFPDARRFACVCGGGSNGGDGRVAARVLREAGHEADETRDVEGYDVVVDALFGTGFHGEPRAEARSSYVASTPRPLRSSRSTSRRASTPRPGKWPDAVEAELTVTFHALKVGLAVAPGRFRAGDASSSPTSASSTPRPSMRVPRASCSSSYRVARLGTRSTRQARFSSSEGSRE